MNDNRQDLYSGKYRDAPLRTGSGQGETRLMPKKRKKKLTPTFIKAWRKHRGLTQMQLSERIGVTQGALSDLENGSFAYTQPMLEAIAEALNVQPADLIRRPPGAAEGLREVLEEMDAEEQRRALAVLKALKSSAA